MQFFKTSSSPIANESEPLTKKAADYHFEVQKPLYFTAAYAGMWNLAYDLGYYIKPQLVKHFEETIPLGLKIALPIIVPLVAAALTESIRFFYHCRRYKKPWTLEKENNNVYNFIPATTFLAAEWTPSLILNLIEYLEKPEQIEQAAKFLKLPFMPIFQGIFGIIVGIAFKKVVEHLKQFKKDEPIIAPQQYGSL